MADFAISPMNYAGAFAGLRDPSDEFTNNLQTGGLIYDQQIKVQQHQLQLQRAQQMQSMAAHVAQDPTPQNVAQLSIAFPEMSEQFKRGYDMLQPAQRDSMVRQVTPVYAALQSGSPDVAVRLLREQAQAYQNAGDDQHAQTTGTMADLVEAHPDMGKMIGGLMLSSAMGHEKFSETFGHLGEETRKQAAAPLEREKIAAETANLQSQVTQRAGQLALDKDKLTSETQLKLKELELQYGAPPPESQKIINESAMNAAAGEQSAARLTDLAARMEQLDGATGSRGATTETLKRIFGVEDGVSALKQEYARIVNNQALGQIKDALGGRVTDVDMKMAMGSVPSANASPQAISSYLRGAAKLQRVEAAMQNARAEWLSQAGRQGHLGPAKTDLSIMGTKVPAGTTFSDFSRQFMQRKAEEIGAQSAVASAQGKSYMRFAQPQQAPNAMSPSSNPLGDSSVLNPGAR